jgi:hypothetical protein
MYSDPTGLLAGGGLKGKLTADRRTDRFEEQAGYWFDTGEWIYKEVETEVLTPYIDEEGTLRFRYSVGYKQVLVFNGSKLFWHQKNGSIISWDAVSGELLNGKTDPSIQMFQGGPIPEGSYFVDSKDMTYFSDLPLWRQIASHIPDLKGGYLASPQGGYPAWGDAFMPILPRKDGRGEREGDYYIHGGATPGSAGCIDLVDLMKNFAEQFNGTGIIPLIIRYPKP